MNIIHGIQFETVNTSEIKHSNTDFGVVLVEQDIGTPQAKTHTVSVNGRDGDIDLTESFGEVKFNNRTLKFKFECIESLKNWEKRKTQIANFLHGQKMKITTWSDSDFYYIGRCTVDEYNSSKSKGTIVINCDCEPYKYKQEITTFQLVSGNNTVTNSSRMTVYADLKCEVEITINNTIYQANTYLKAIKLVNGENSITSSGAATLSYREGEL